MKLPIKIDKYGSCIDADGETLTVKGMALSCGPSNPQAEANTAYIINAVNNHAALVEALEEIVSWHWDGLRVMPGHVDWVAALEDIERASKALAAAKGGSQ